ncbi:MULTISPECIES: hypothetical protein [Calothrix]|nr:hypothetical protein [Calothrix anomala]MBD2196448.1 hypothetical protein [Calothrix parietina FACHB-288]
MQIISISNSPIYQIQYLTAASSGLGLIERYLPILLAEVDLLPNNLHAIIITSDLQGIDPKNHQLLAYLLLEELETLNNGIQVIKADGRAIVIQVKNESLLN